MRPASEIHSSLDMVESELDRMKPSILAIMRGDDTDLTAEQADARVSLIETWEKLELLADVLRWVAGAHWTDLTDGPNGWLAAYLLDDPPKIDETSAEEN